MTDITRVHWIPMRGGRLMPAMRATAGVLVVGLAACGTGSAQRIDGPDAAPGASVDATAPPDAASPDAAASNDALDRACTPGVTLEIEDTDTARAALIRDALGDPPSDRIQEIGRTVCRILYRDAGEVRDATHLTLYLRYAPDDVAWKSGDGANIEVMISTAHIANVDRQGRDVAREVQGILFHEMTHMYQHDDSDGRGADGGLIEGIADFVRFKAGYAPDGAQPNPDGNWNDGYRTTAFFLVWVDSQYPGFAHDLNLSMDSRDGERWTPEAFRTITGKSADELWTDYRATF
jgi:hypothetical protein